jgi:4a-hydroxytetrahydrobiopterin dehydratase
MALMCLNNDQIDQRLRPLRGWNLDTTPPRIHKTWAFDRFESVVWFFNQVAQLAVAQDHHPDIWLNHSQLRIRLWTHDAAGLTEKDFALAEAIERLGPDPSMASPSSLKSGGFP